MSHYQTEDEVNAALFELQQTRLKRQKLQVDRDSQVAVVREACRKQVDPLNKRIREIERRLKSWSTKQRKAWRAEKRESVNLTHGRLGFRRRPSNALEAPRKGKAEVEAKLIPKLEALGLRRCVAVHKSVDWQELSKESDETLAVLGLKRPTGDRWYVDLTIAKAAVGS